MPHNTVNVGKRLIICGRCMICLSCFLCHEICYTLNLPNFVSLFMYLILMLCYRKSIEFQIIRIIVYQKAVIHFIAIILKSTSNFFFFLLCRKSHPFSSVSSVMKTGYPKKLRSGKGIGINHIQII